MKNGSYGGYERVIVCPVFGISRALDGAFLRHMERLPAECTSSLASSPLNHLEILPVSVSLLPVSSLWLLFLVALSSLKLLLLLALCCHSSTGFFFFIESSSDSDETAYAAAANAVSNSPSLE